MTTACAVMTTPVVSVAAINSAARDRRDDHNALIP
jgi:hypothetical protein